MPQWKTDTDRSQLGSGLDRLEDSDPLRNDRRDTVITFDRIVVGKEYDVRGSSGIWLEGKVQKIDTDNLRVFVEYLCLNSEFDEWIYNVESCIAPLHSRTYYVGGTLKKGQLIEVQDIGGNWLEAFVVDTMAFEVKVSFRSYHYRHDEWLDRHSERIRPFSQARSNKYGLSYIRREGRLWRVPGSGVSDHNKENLGLKRPYDSSKMGESKAAANESDDPLGGAASGPAANITDDERKRKIVAGAVNYIRYEEALHAHGLRVVPVRGDGNCLFRSVSHQMYGTEDQHAVVRSKVMDYMEAEGDFFCQFVEGGKEMFPYYLNAKRENGCWGDDPEIEAICELYQRPAEIWAFDAVHGARKLRTFHENQLTHCNSSRLISPRGRTNNPAEEEQGENGARRLGGGQVNNPVALRLEGGLTAVGGGVMRLSYYGGGHYDSVVRDLEQQEDRGRGPLVVMPSSCSSRGGPAAEEEGDEVVPRRRPRSRSNSEDFTVREEEQRQRQQTSQFPLQGMTPGLWEDAVIARAVERTRAGGGVRRTRESTPRSTVMNNNNGAASVATAVNTGSARQWTSEEEDEEQQLLSAIEASRRAALEADYDDLETCLAQSMRESEGVTPMVATGGSEGGGGQSSGGGSSSVVGNVSSPQTSQATLGGAADLLAIQGNLLQSIQAQSEMEYLDRAILSSLADESQQLQREQQQRADQRYANEDEEEARMLEEAKRESEREYNQQLQQQQRQSGGSSSARSSGGGGAAQYSSHQLSSLSEDEALELALRQSLEDKRLYSASFNAAVAASNSSSSNRGGPSYRHSEGDISLYQMNDEEALQMALNASMRTADAHAAAAAASRSGGQSNSSAHNSNAAGGGQFYVTTAEGYLEEMDEELVRAIEESMKK